MFRLFFDIKVTRSSVIRSSGCTVDRTTLNVIIVLIYISGDRNGNLLVAFNFKALVFVDCSQVEDTWHDFNPITIALSGFILARLDIQLTHRDPK